MVCDKQCVLPPWKRPLYESWRKKKAAEDTKSSAAMAFTCRFDQPRLQSECQRADDYQLDGPAVTVFAVNELIDFGHVGTLEVLCIPLNSTAFFRTHGQIANQNGFCQAAGVAEV